MSQPQRHLFDSYASAKGSRPNNNPTYTPKPRQLLQSPSARTIVPTVAFQTIIFGIMRQLFKEIEENSERARVFAQACSSTLSPRDLQAIAQFQGQLGSSDTLGGDPPYPVAENMEISRRYVLYEGGCFDREDGERICKFSQKQP
ncbi:hypothetical protein HRG_013620 [Hirsutella rhossiliensis]